MVRHTYGPPGRVQLRRRNLTMRNPKLKDDSPREIWLSPPCVCDRNGSSGRRTWADFEFPPCSTCGTKPTRYTRPGLKLKWEGKQ